MCVVFCKKNILKLFLEKKIKFHNPSVNLILFVNEKIKNYLFFIYIIHALSSIFRNFLKEVKKNVKKTRANVF